MAYTFALWVLLWIITHEKSAEGLLCYSCTDVSNNDECFNITVCPREEECYGRADGLTTAQIKHTTGCTKELKPIKRNDTAGVTFCTKSCNTDLCNLHKCQFGNVSRGPRCRSCDLVNSPEECHTVVECGQDDLCFTEKILAFKQEKYRLGCINKQHCRRYPKNTMIPVGRRSLAYHCSLCCQEDHCNLHVCEYILTEQSFHLESMSPNTSCDDLDAALCSVFGKLNADSCKEDVVVKTCPKSCMTCDHVGWGAWQSWGTCSKSCNTGTRIRRRNCSHRLNITWQQKCIGDSFQTEPCFKHCPVNGGWCYNYNLCTFGTDTQPNCPSGGPSRTTCNCPAPMYGGTCPP